MANKKLKNWLTKKYQIVFHKKNYEIIGRLNANIWQIILFAFLLAIVIFTINYFLIGYTPIEATLPDFPDAEQKKLIKENYYLCDSLFKEVEKRDKYLNMIRDFILDDVPIDEKYVVSPNSLTDKEIEDFNNPTTKRKEKAAQATTFKKSQIPKLFKPIEGKIVNEFNTRNEHYGIDIVSEKETTVNATLSGIVILTDFTLKYGYTIIIQHSNDLISIYKHCASILITQGSFVEIGQAIATYGNSGEETSGKHLHFELWGKGHAINPSEYIIF